LELIGAELRTWSSRPGKNVQSWVSACRFTRLQ